MVGYRVKVVDSIAGSEVNSMAKNRDLQWLEQWTDRFY